MKNFKNIGLIVLNMLVLLVLLFVFFDLSAVVVALKLSAIIVLHGIINAIIELAAKD